MHGSSTLVICSHSWHQFTYCQCGYQVTKEMAGFQTQICESLTFAGVPAPSYMDIVKFVWFRGPGAEGTISNNHIVWGCCSSQIFLVNESSGTPPHEQPIFFFASPGSGCREVVVHLEACTVSPVGRVLSGQASMVVHTANKSSWFLEIRSYYTALLLRLCTAKLQPKTWTGMTKSGSVQLQSGPSHPFGQSQDAQDE
jgi:hypothetical protein